MPDKPLHQQGWEVLSETVEFDATPWVKVTRHHVRLPNGVEIPDFYMVDMPIYVVIFAVTAAHELVMVEQYRHGAKGVVLELPAGNIDTAPTVESARAAAERELLEETGYTAPHWQFMGNFYVDSNRSGGGLYAFLATDAEASGTTALEATEIIHTHALPLADVRRMWLAGEIGNIATNAVLGLGFAHLGGKA